MEGKMRSLNKIIDQILEIAPDLEPRFESLKISVGYTAPEMMAGRWSEAASILNINAKEHPKREEIAKIFAGV